MHEAALSAATWNRAVDMCAEDQDGDIAGQAVYAAINCMLDQAFIFLGSKITADGDCSHEIKRRLLLGRKVMTNLDSVLESKDITLSQRSA